MVLGHSNCGAVAATIKGSAVPGQISVLYPHIQPAVDLAGPNVEAAIKANAKLQAAIVAEGSTVTQRPRQGTQNQGSCRVLRCSKWKGDDGRLDASPISITSARSRVY
jgi:carbonic anhydrase